MKMWIVTLLILAIGASFGAAQTNVDATQLQAWQNFFDKTGGSAWTRCKNKRSSPCTCEGTANALVTCTDVEGTLFITSILLRNNNLVGPNVPGTELETIISGYEGFTSLDLTQNSKLQNRRGGCLRVPSCNVSGITCRFDYTVCPVDPNATGSPTAGGSVTAAPTTAAPGTGTSSPSLTPAPSTSVPGTSAPTTAGPTNAPPTTGSPSSTDTPATSTKSPTTGPPSTSSNSPTSSTTTSPSPSAPPTGTKSPTFQVGTQTQSPTQSSASLVSASTMLAAVASFVAALILA